jgi:hypothetical protein
MKGEQVKWVQYALNAIMDATLVIDGSCGPETQKAIKAFQTEYKLQVDGSFGPYSRAKMIALLKAQGWIVGGGRTEAWINIINSGFYHEKCKTPLEGGKEMVLEYFNKGNMHTTLSSGNQGEKIRTVVRDKKVYNVFDEERTAIVSPYTGGSLEEPKRDVLIATGSGTAQFNGKNLPYDEYSIKGVSDFKQQFFIDGNNLAGIRSFVGKTTLDQIVLVLDQNVPDSMFEIPAGYKKFDQEKEILDFMGYLNDKKR